MERTAIEKTIQHYFIGTSEANIPRLKMAYTPGCKIYFINDGGELDYLDQERFYEVVLEMHGVSGKRENEILSIEITNNIAIAKTRSDYPKFFFIDYLSLINIGSEWKIVNKLTVRKNK